MTTPDPIDWAALLADLEHHGCHTWILYGSRARGDAHAASDIDLLGIRAGGEPDHDTRIWRGYFLDAFIYPAERFETIGEDWLHLHGGRVLSDDAGLATRILAGVEAAFQAGPKPLAEHDRRSRIAWMHKMVGRIVGRGADDIEADYRRAWLLMQILEDYFQLCGRWYRGPKESFLWLKVHEPETHAAFAVALTPGADLAAIRALVERVTAMADAR
jgi:PAS domain-containing protein